MPDNEGTDKGFDIKFEALPPKLQLQLWILGLDANTSKVNIAYKSGGFTTGLAYNYGGNVEASMSLPRFSTTLGVNPGNGDVNLGVAFRGFNFGSSASIANKSVGFSFGYSASLLPFPAELSTTFNSAATGLQNIAGDLGSAPNNPLDWYKMHSDDVTAITKAVSLGQQIAKSGDKDSGFGVGLRINYTPQTGFVIYGGAQFIF